MPTIRSAIRSTASAARPAASVGGGDDFVSGYISASATSLTEGDSVTFTFVLTSVSGELSVDDDTPASGGSFTLTYAPTTYAYQWKKDGSNIGGATNSTLTINPVATSDTGSYSVVVSDGTRSKTIAAVTIEVDTVKLLDAVTGAYGACSLRKLRGSQTNSITVRRDSDDTTLDIGFIGDDLDTASIAAFCGSGSGYVSKVYDQSGNGRDFIQATTENQLIIYESGVLVTDGGKPAMKFTQAAARRLTHGAAGGWNFLHNGTTAWFASMVTRCVNTASGGTIFSTQGTSGGSIGYTLQRTSVELLQTQCGNGSVSVIASTGGGSSTSRVLNSVKVDPANSTAASRAVHFGNGSDLSVSNASTGTPTTSNSVAAFHIGAKNGANLPFEGTMQELIIWNSDKSSDRATIEANMNAYWSVY